MYSYCFAQESYETHRQHQKEDYKKHTLESIPNSPIPNSQFPIPQFPIPQFPIPNSQFPIPMTDRQLNGFEQNTRPAQAVANSLGIIFNPSGEASAIAGSDFELSITVSNQGNKSAIIDIFISDSSQPVRQWCSTPDRRLGLNPGQSSEIVFTFQIPADTIPNPYDYQIVLDAPEHYPEETPIQYPLRLQILPFVREARTVSDPTFSLLPATSSDKPASLQPGEQLEIEVFVQNRSDRVDRFRLACTDKTETWFTIIYPESYSAMGLVASGEALELNPGEQSQITLTINPPPDTWAGIYASTVRLYSENNPDLVLLDVIYIQIIEVYLVNVEMLARTDKVKDKAGLFELRFQNLGNTLRNITLRASGADEDNTCTYTLAPPRVGLLPGGYAKVGLQVEPTRRWRRPFYGKLINFVVELEDADNLPLISDRFQGSLMWEPRPWWQFLLAFILIISAIAGLVFLIWWSFFRPRPRPKLVYFSPTSSLYEAVNNEAIHLNWRIDQPNQIKNLRIVGLSPDGVVTSDPIVYDLSSGIPKELQNFCTIEKLLICQNVRTDALAAGDYTFEITLTPKPGKGHTPVTLRTNTVRIEPLPIPEIVELVSSQPFYQEQSGRPIALNWKITNPNQIERLILVSLAADNSVQSRQNYDLRSGLPQALQLCNLNPPQELTCRGVPTSARQAGDYTFELTAIAKNSSNNVSKQSQVTTSATAKTKLIRIQPTPVAKIVQFASVQPVYEEAAWGSVGGVGSVGNVGNVGSRHRSLGRKGGGGSLGEGGLKQTAGYNTTYSVICAISTISKVSMGRAAGGGGGSDRFHGCLQFFIIVSLL